MPGDGHGKIERQRLTDPLSERSVIGKIIVGEWVRERGQSGLFEQRNDLGYRSLAEISLELCLGCGPTGSSRNSPTKRMTGFASDNR